MSSLVFCDFLSIYTKSAGLAIGVVGDAGVRSSNRFFLFKRRLARQDIRWNDSHSHFCRSFGSLRAYYSTHFVTMIIKVSQTKSI
jgi:hypothetical protein